MTPTLTAKTVDAVIAQLAFNADGLVPAIAQQQGTGEILMMAWMNEDAVRETLDTNRVCYWSRSRSRLWRKGHTGRRSCFFNAIRNGEITAITEPEVNPDDMYG